MNLFAQHAAKTGYEVVEMIDVAERGSLKGAAKSYSVMDETSAPSSMLASLVETISQAFGQASNLLSRLFTFLFSSENVSSTCLDMIDINGDGDDDFDDDAVELTDEIMAAREARRAAAHDVEAFIRLTTN